MPSTSNVDQYTLETPENIEVEFELAGLGSRFCAMLIDSLLIAVGLFAVFLLFVFLGVDADTWFYSRQWVRWLEAALLAIAMVLLFEGYFILFEWLMRGQTPGKRQMRIRVIRDDGTAVTVNEVLLRNILRIVDFLPFGYALGTLVMFPSPLCKRLGDLAAGTIVVKEGQLDYRAEADKKQHFVTPLVKAANTELTAEERRLLTGFLQRRIELLPKARRDLAERLAAPLYVKYGGQHGDAERYLERLVEGRHYES